MAVLLLLLLLKQWVRAIGKGQGAGIGRGQGELGLRVMVGRSHPRRRGWANPADDDVPYKVDFVRRFETRYTQQKCIEEEVFHLWWAQRDACWVRHNRCFEETQGGCGTSYS